MNKSVEDTKKQQFFKKSQCFFCRFAQHSSHEAGRARSFVLALVLVFLWGASGPFLSFSVSWQVAINTICSIAILLMVLLIQNTQNRDTQAIQMKLDELLQTNQNAHTDLIEIEKLTEDEIEEVCNIQREIRGQGDGSHSRRQGHRWWGERQHEIPSNSIKSVCVKRPAQCSSHGR